MQRMTCTAWIRIECELVLRLSDRSLVIKPTPRNVGERLGSAPMLLVAAKNPQWAPKRPWRAFPSVFGLAV